jgi:hypothetical protein
MIHLRTILLFLGLFAASPSFADWMALAVGDAGTWGISLRKSSKKQAESAALKECVKAKGVKCRVVGSKDQLGYVALASSKTWVTAQIEDTLADAKRAALDKCAKETSTDDSCTIEWTGINGVVRDNPQTAQTNDCRPRTPELRCRSNCVNGNCVVEYENGCKIRVQVSPRFDSFSNQWTYPSPSC